MKDELLEIPRKGMTVMEGLLPVIIMIIIGAIFNSGKKKTGDQPQKRPVKPVLPKQPPRKPNVQMTEREKMHPMETKQHENPMDKLKELSREFYKEIQQEFEEVPVKEERPVFVERKIDQLPKRAIKKEEQPTVVEPVVQHRQKRKQTASNKPNVIPKTQNDMMQGIIFAEIIGPPKSKR